MKLSVRTTLALLALVALCWPPGTARAQGVTTGSMTGVVLDAQKQAVPGASVVAVHEPSGTRYEATSRADGRFSLPGLRVGGPYTVTAKLAGFRDSSIKDIEVSLGVANDLTVTLNQAAMAEELTVTAESSEVFSSARTGAATAISRETIQNLPTISDRLNDFARLSPQYSGGGSFVGQDSRLNNITVDGSYFNNSFGLASDGQPGSRTGVAPISSAAVEEIQVNVAPYDVRQGHFVGAGVNMVTRSGTNQFHGSGYYWWRDQGLVGTEAKGLTYNPGTFDYKRYGGWLGGPVIKDKLFFFAGVEWKQIDRFTSPSLQTLPTTAMRAGNFSHLTTALKDPLTGQPFPGNVIPASRITADGKAFANFYDQMSQIANSYTDTPTANNALFQRANPFRWRQEMLRLDYNINPAHRLTARVMLDHYTLTEPYGTFIGGNLPTVPTDRNRPGWNLQLNHNWTITNNLLNEVKVNYSGNNQSIDPVGDTWQRSTYGFQFPQIYPNGGTYEDSIPVGSISGFAGWQSASNALISPTKDFALADTLTILKGAHTVKTGVLGIFNTKKQNGRSPYAGNVTFNPSGNPNSTGNAFADALLGNFRSYSEAQLDPVGRFRFYQVEAFVTDGWRVTPNFSVEVGLRYTYHYPTVTKGNNLTAFDPGHYDAAKAVKVNTNGTLVPGSGDRYNGLVRPGDVPDSEKSVVPNADSPAVQGVPIADSRGIYDAQHLFMPRFSFAWSPGRDGKTAVRGGIGLYYDRPEGNLYFGLPNNPPFALSASYENGNLANPGGAAVPALAPWASMQSVSTDFRIPRSWNWSVSLQRELPWWGLFAEVAYVGADGSNLMRRPDINLPSFADREANAAGPKYNTNYLRPYKGFADIQMGLSDAGSSYHAAQFFLSKRRGDLNFTLNYTLGRSYDNGSGNFDNPADGPEDIAYYWGPSDYDRRHIFVATWTYKLPFFRESRGFLGQALGGWEVSGIARYQTGAPLTISGPTSIGGRRADYKGGDPYAADLINSSTGAVQWLTKSAFASAPEGRRGNSERGQFRGPAYSVLDVSLRKQFSISNDVKLQVQADFFNVLNHVNWGNPNTDLSSASFGLITGITGQPRNIQLGARVIF